MKKFEYSYPMAAGGKVMTPVTQMIDYLNAQIELYEAATGRKNQTLQNALGFAMNLRTSIEEPLLKGIYMEASKDVFRAFINRDIKDVLFEDATNLFFKNTFEL